MDMRDFFNSFLREFKELQIFALCKDFDDLSLDDTESSASTSTSTSTSINLSELTSNILLNPNILLNRGIRSSYLQHLHNTIAPPLRSVIEPLRAPFVGVSQDYIEAAFAQIEPLPSIARGVSSVSMALGFRFPPGQSTFLLNEIQLPECLDSLSFVCNSLGLFYSTMGANSLLSYSRHAAGLLGENSELNKVLVEVITNVDGLYGRFFILVWLGVGCTVWYDKVWNRTLGEGLFARIGDYEAFYDMDFVPSFYPFRKLTFLETCDPSSVVDSAFANTPPFAQISIPASGPVLKAVSLGVMIGFFLAVGIVPNLSSFLKDR